MAVKIRLKKMGRKGRPSYRVVAADARSKRDGKEIEVLGHYDPLVADKEKQVALNRERVQYWLGVGAQPTDTVAGMLLRACLKIARGAAARDFGWGQGGEAGASPQWAVMAECVGHGDELGGESPLWGLRKATTS